MNDAENEHSITYSTWDYIKWFTDSIICQIYMCRKNPDISKEHKVLENSNCSQEKPGQNPSEQCTLKLECKEILIEETPNFTLIDKYFRDLKLGIISADEFDSYKREIFSEVIPRNLSHDFVSKDKIYTRKMNNWITPPALPKNKIISESEIGEEPTLTIPIKSQQPLITECISSSIEDERVNNFERLREALAKEAANEKKYLENKICQESGYRPKRCSSLKASKKEGIEEDETCSKKVVRFADALGLDLSVTKLFKDGDKPPILPDSALSDLNINFSKEYSSVGQKFFQLNFAQPCSCLDFYQRVLENKILLENVSVDNSRHGSIMGIIRVKSLSFEKIVQVRITYNNWATFNDVKASYVINSHDRITDKFSFMIVFPSSLVCGDKAEFAVTYQIPDGEKFWDNNNGLNYQVVCYAKQTLYQDTSNWMNIY